ncbi:MAG: endonuclease/exonuclease/phosphatase family protein [Ferruginibacter sp.]
MTASTKKIIIGSLFILNVLFLVLMLCSNLALVVNPAGWWIVGVLGLMFPLLLLVNLSFMIVWLFINRKKALICFIAILISYPNISRCFAFHVSDEFSEFKEDGAIRVITWNVALMNLQAKDTETAAAANAQILNSIDGLNADVLCLQEFLTAIVPGNKYNILDSITRRYNFPYCYFFLNNNFHKDFHPGTVIFSKYKIVDSSRIIFPAPFFGSVLRAGLLVNKDTIDIITTRLQSDHLQGEDYEALHNLKNGAGSNISGTENILKKLKNGYKKRSEQIDLAINTIHNSSRPIIFTGDMNDVPSSYTYSKISHGMQDAWLEAGSGIGRTFRFISPTLRIDYIFHNHFFETIQTRRIITTGSDHYGLVADFRLKK